MLWSRILVISSCCLLRVGYAFLARRQHGIKGPGAPTLQIDTRFWSSQDGADEEAPSEPIAVTIDTTLSDDKMRSLFAWIRCAFDRNPYDPNDVYAYYYSNIELAIASAFGNNLPKDSMPAKLMEMAIKSAGDVNSKEWEEALIGDAISRRERESASLGAMGAAQWSGRFMTRPHCKSLCFGMKYVYDVAPYSVIFPALLDVRNFTSVDDWVKTLPRGCKRTIKKALPELQNFTVTNKLIRGGKASPHSSYAHFRCVVEHEGKFRFNFVQYQLHLC
jgi:hypothetical protein